MILANGYCVAWEQGRRLSPPICGLTGFREVIQYIAPLLSQCGDDSHNAFHEATSCFALGTEAAVAPQHTGTDLSLTKVIGRYHTFNAYECPQGLLTFEDVSAGSGGLAVVASRSLMEQFLDVLLNRVHLVLKGGPTHCSVPYLVPPLKHQIGLDEESFANPLRFVSPVHEGLEVTKEVCPA